MSKITELFDYFRTCPQLADAWSIGATEDVGVAVILPQGSSDRYEYRDSWDVDGGYNLDIVPFPTVYEDYQINCYKIYDAGDRSAPDTNINALSFDEVQAICDWIAVQDAVGNLPTITGECVVALECRPFVPQIRYVNETENVVAYYVTVRVRYVNRAKARSVYADES